MLLATNAPPFTPTQPVTEILYGIPVTDRYRWLEEQPSLRRREWLEQQSAYTPAYLSAIPECGRTRQRVEELPAAEVVYDFGRSAIGTSVWGARLVREQPLSQDTGGSPR